jgi:hypothetical protein
MAAFTAMATPVLINGNRFKAKTLGMFNKGEGGFLDRDLSPLCTNLSDGKLLANPSAKPNLGKDVRKLKDATGKAYGQELFVAGQKPAGQISEVSHVRKAG